jgi:hypothetical protein
MDHRTPLRILAPAAAAASLVGLAGAQSTLFQLDGVAANDRFGQAVAAAGDVNGDGVGDVIVGAPENGNIFGGGTGYASVHSGADGALLLTVNGNGGPDAYGNSVAGVGDLDGDGLGDVAVGAPFDDGPGLSRGRVEVYSGATGALLHAFVGDLDGDRLGHKVAAAGDVNGDGVPDIAACAFGSDVVTLNSGTTFVWSGLDGSLLQRWEGATNNAHLGVSIAAAGDVDGDGSGDLFVGGLTGDVQLLSGATGAALGTYPAPAANDVWGASLDVAGDLDGDGWPELLVGAPQNSVFGSGAGYARLLDGASGATLAEFVGDQQGDEFGSSVAAIGDHDGDGTPDYLIGAPASPDPARRGYARVHSGATGALLKQFLAVDGTTRLGHSVAALGDLQGDGAVDYAVGEPDAADPGILSGQVIVASGVGFVCTPPVVYCVSLPNTSGAAGSIGSSGTNSVAANDLVLSASGCPSGQVGIFFYGTSRAFVPLSSGIRCVGGQIFRLPPALTVDAAGAVSTPLDLAGLPNASGQIAVGETWHFQFWFRDPGDGLGGTNLTDALEVTFCP